MYFVLDVESIGLYGLGFAVGWVVVDETGATLEEGYLACPHREAVHSASDPSDLEWVETHVCPHLPDSNCEDLPELYDSFWVAWLAWKQEGAVLVADCAYPVETNFLRSCVLNDMSRKWEGPYPVVDVSSVLLAKGFNPTKEFDRKENELPQHNPLCDARQSARILIETLML